MQTFSANNINILFGFTNTEGSVHGILELAIILEFYMLSRNVQSLEDRNIFEKKWYKNKANSLLCLN